MRKYSVGIICGLLIGIAISACAGGKRSIKYKNFAQRSDEYSVRSKCKDGDDKNICKYYCDKYTKYNKCKKGYKKVKKRDLKKSLDQGFVVMSKSLWIELMQNSH